MADSSQNEWITQMLVGSTSTTPAKLLEEVMADPRCVAFGPVNITSWAAYCLPAGATQKLPLAGTACLPPTLKRLQNVPTRCPVPHAPTGAYAGQQLPPAWLTPSSALMPHCKKKDGQKVNFWCRIFLPPLPTQEPRAAASATHAWQSAKPSVTSTT